MVKLRYVVQYDGRVYFRRKGQPKTRLRGPVGSCDFLADYHAALTGTPLPKAKKQRSYSDHTLGWLVTKYKASTHFASLKPSTRLVRERTMQRIIDTGGDAALDAIDRAAIVAGRDKRRDTPSAANHFVVAMRNLFEFALENGYCNHNPCDGVKQISYKQKSHESWPPEMCEKFRNTYPIGTRERLAFELAYWLGVRRSDLVTLGPQHVKDGYIAFTIQKTGERIELPVPAQLQSIIAASPKNNFVFIQAQNKKPFSVKSFGNVFSKWCAKAGIPKGYTLHGLRHALGNDLAEAGCSPHEIAAALGHTNTKTVATYTSKASRKRLADSAFTKLDRTGHFSRKTAQNIGK